MCNYESSVGKCLLPMSLYVLSYYVPFCNTRFNLQFVLPGLIICALGQFSILILFLHLSFLLYFVSQQNILITGILQKFLTRTLWMEIGKRNQVLYQRLKG